MISILTFKKYSYIFSLCLLSIFVFGIFYKKKTRGAAFLYGIEFSGGVQMECEISSLDKKNITSEEIKEYLESNEKEFFSVRKLMGSVFIIRIPFTDEKKGISYLTAHVKDLLINHYGNCVIRDSSLVGAGVSKNLALKAVLSILVAFFLMFLYVWIRFKSWAFSVANAVSLFHDVLVILLMILWFNYEITLEIVGSILFIIGYSINDTIVIFSRIRENQIILKEKTFDFIINASIKETLRRTLLTSSFTALVVLPLWVLGGVNLEPLSAAVLLGIIFGTYSSIAIATPILYDCY
jgi:preprotein translocase subunit SecF